MALQISKEMSTGVVANYWSIKELKIDDNIIVIRLDLYISKELKDAGKAPVYSRNFRIDHDKAVTVNSNVYELAYNGIKASDEFSSALDV